MEFSAKAEPLVTIVVVPRERFSFTRESLESIYMHTESPFKLVYVDGNSPPAIRHYLETEAHARGFQLVRTEYYLSPNQARNLGLHHVNSKYVIFIDNDVLVTPGWLSQLVQSTEKTGASVVAPLTCIGKPVHEIIHLAGGEAHIKLKQKGDQVGRFIHQKHHFVGRQVADVRDQLRLQQCEFAEFHCMLVCTEIFSDIGALDEGLLNTREHLDFCMMVSQAGGTIYCEPESVVTYVPGPPFELSDIPYFILRWSDAWEMASLQHFRNKWDLIEDADFKARYKQLGWRRHHAFFKPLIRHLTFRRGSTRLEEILLPIERRLNRYLTTRYARNQTKLDYN